jgi:von Willebrand factor type A domain
LSISSVSYVGSGAYKNVAISAVLDHSGSLTDQPVAFADMKAGFTSLLSGLKPGDVAEIIKFATEYEVIQAFTSDKASLTAAIAAPFSKGRTTLLYDTVHKAVTDTALQTNYRRAVIVATDGIDEGDTVGVPLSTNTVQTVIDHALLNKVPIFAIGIGASVNSSDLQKMASDTGGLYYQANASQNLATIYQQLASLLYENQYVLTFNRIVTGTLTAQSPIGITARSGGVSGNDARGITACP